MADSDRVVRGMQVEGSAYNQTLLVAAATVTISPSPVRLAAIYARSSTTGTTSVTGFQTEDGSACSLTIASAVSGCVLAPPRPMYVTNLIVNTNTAADARKFLFVWKSAD